MKKSFVLLFLAVVKCQSQSNDCPSSEDIKPCTCKSDRQNLPSVKCDGLSSADQLQRATKGMKQKKMSDFLLSGSRIGVLPGDTFKDLGIFSLSIMYTNLTSLSETQNRPPFIGLEDSLQTLQIKDCFLNDSIPLTKLSLSHLKKLYSLQLEGNIMPLIPNDWFEMGPYLLRDLYLMETGVAKVGSHAFEALEQLRRFALTGGSITTIVRDVFPTPAIHLMHIDLSNNRIDSLPDNMFYQMPSLEEVFLDNNALTTISEKVFAPVWNLLTHVLIYGCPIDCNKDIKWIYKYRLPEVYQGYCVSPPQLRNKFLHQLALTDFE